MSGVNTESCLLCLNLTGRTVLVLGNLKTVLAIKKFSDKGPQRLRNYYRVQCFIFVVIEYRKNTNKMYLFLKLIIMKNRQEVRYLPVGFAVSPRAAPSRTSTTESVISVCTVTCRSMGKRAKNRTKSIRIDVPQVSGRCIVDVARFGRVRLAARKTRTPASRIWITTHVWVSTWANHQRSKIKYAFYININIYIYISPFSRVRTA